MKRKPVYAQLAELLKEKGVLYSKGVYITPEEHESTFGWRTALQMDNTFHSAIYNGLVLSVLPKQDVGDVLGTYTFNDLNFPRSIGGRIIGIDKYYSPQQEMNYIQKTLKIMRSGSIERLFRDRRQARKGIGQAVKILKLIENGEVPLPEGTETDALPILLTNKVNLHSSYRKLEEIAGKASEYSYILNPLSEEDKRAILDIDVMELATSWEMGSLL